MSEKTRYIAPVSLWLAVRKIFLADGSVFIEPAWVGSHQSDEQGPVIFTSRMLADVYVHTRNTYHSADDSGNWKTLPLSEFDLLEHTHALPGKLYCMMAFGICLATPVSMIVATGAPRIRYMPLPFDIAKDAGPTIFSFNQWVFDFIRKECKAIGFNEFEQDMEATDEMNPPVFERASKVAIASINVCRNPTPPETNLWGLYSVRSEKWVIGHEAEHYDKTMH